MQDGRQTDIDKFQGFWAEFQKRLQNVTLLATVLLTTNVAFLAIQSVDQQGLAYLPQKCSYISVMVNLGSIVGGFALRMPRVLRGSTVFHLDTIALILGFPSTLFLYGRTLVILDVCRLRHILVSLCRTLSCYYRVFGETAVSFPSWR
ncbi:hypothetical protein EV401DRAFT_296814 [Pisolithus croceorrhizus]|nr:hypothetical protein EV401DRAFT_296814 [Pisolithus croceorrhizus]